MLDLAKATSTSTSPGTSLKTSTGVSSSSIIRVATSTALSREAGKSRVGALATMTVAAMTATSAKVSSNKTSGHQEERGAVVEPTVGVIIEAVTRSPPTVAAEEVAGEVETKT